MTNKQLQKLCKYWQRVLRLEDVDVNVRYAEFMEMEDWGISAFTLDRTGVSIVINPRERKGDSLSDSSEEVTLVHELLHVQERHWANTQDFRDYLDKTTLRGEHEASIERNAQALVGLRRSLESSL